MRRVFEQSNDDTYVVSLSSRTIVYKGMFLVGQLRTFLRGSAGSRITNPPSPWYIPVSPPTPIPAGSKRHPNRFIVHNGEINTIRGNADKMLAREENMESEHLKDELHKVTAGDQHRPVPIPRMLDNTLEFLVMSGMDLPLAVMITIPEPWAEQQEHVPEKERFLSVLRHHDGALGRPGIHPFLRRRYHGSCAGQERSAPFPILYHR